VAEYHELYELQRRRLAGQMSQLYDERDLWRKATYSLTVKVIFCHIPLDMNNSLILKEFLIFDSKCLTFLFQIVKINKLHLVRRLNISEQTWANTADRFTGFLTTKVHLQYLLPQSVKTITCRLMVISMFFFIHRTQRMYPISWN